MLAKAEAAPKAIRLLSKALPEQELFMLCLSLKDFKKKMITSSCAVWKYSYYSQ